MRLLWQSYRLWLVLWLLSTALVLLVSTPHIHSQLSRQLTSQLPVIVDATFESSHGFSNLLTPRLINNLNQQLVNWSAAHQSALVACQINIQAIGEGEPVAEALVWQSGLMQRHASYQLECGPVWSSLLIATAGVLLLLSVIALSLPRVVSTGELQLIRQLRQQGMPTAEIQSLLVQVQIQWHSNHWNLFNALKQAQINTKWSVELINYLASHSADIPQADWFVLAARHYAGQPQQAVAFALAEDQLRLSLSSGQVWIRGLEVHLSRTPMLYYYWYAQQRQNQEQGWVLNPASNKPNQQYAEELLMLMELGKGHKKAMLEIEQGLKAKTLDQNRSKIRDELQQQLGTALAASYLFDCHKDVKTNRFYYRLVTSPDCIELIP